jgi:hypothetical protein
MSQQPQSNTGARRPTNRDNVQRNNPKNSMNDVGFTPAAITDVPDEKNESLAVWVNQLYTFRPTSDELKVMYEALSYKGFNRDDVLKQLHKLSPDVKIITEIVIAIALRGPQAASRIQLSNGKSLIQMGIPASGGQGSKILTCNKIQASTADLAAYYLKILNPPKRLMMECPAWLQFPSAGSIRMPENHRQAHFEFSKRFSEIIGGVFQEQIYTQMVANSYLDERLNLF